MRQKKSKKYSILHLLRSYSWLIFWLIFLSVLSNGANLAIPKIVAHSIDAYTAGNFQVMQAIFELALLGIAIFVFTYLQSIVQVYTSEKVALDLRTQLIRKIAQQNYSYVQNVTSAKLLTHLTSDVDAVKNFVAQSISSVISSVFIVLGTSVLLLWMNWQLALMVLLVVPVVAVLFYLVFRRVKTLFRISQEAVDHLNRVIHENILGSGLVRILNSQQYEYEKFLTANMASRDIGIRILRLFAGLMPVILFATNAATMIILIYGGYSVIFGSMTLGDFTAFNSYLALLIFPILVLGFTSNAIAQSAASYSRIREVLDVPHTKHTGKLVRTLTGSIDIKDVELVYDSKTILRNISLHIQPGTNTAIIGPTAAGKTQLLYLLTGLLKPTKGTIEYDKKNIDLYDKKGFYQQLGFVFQESSIFNLSLRENIAFSSTIKDVDLEKAIATAELGDFIDTLPHKIDTVVSERGTSLSGGQKQRVMLARALASRPKILFLDDFTARLDIQTEQKILANLRANYPDITLISVTEKIDSIKHFDQIILLMEGDILAVGTHEELLKKSPEYSQIFISQQSTNTYEL